VWTGPRVVFNASASHSAPAAINATGKINTAFCKFRQKNPRAVRRSPATTYPKEVDCENGNGHGAGVKIRWRGFQMRVLTGPVDRNKKNIAAARTPWTKMSRRREMRRTRAAPQRVLKVPASMHSQRDCVSATPSQRIPKQCTHESGNNEHRAEKFCRSLLFPPAPGGEYYSKFFSAVLLSAGLVGNCLGIRCDGVQKRNPLAMHGRYFSVLVAVPLALALSPSRHFGSMAFWLPAMFFCFCPPARSILSFWKPRQRIFTPAPWPFHFPLHLFGDMWSPRSSDRSRFFWRKFTEGRIDFARCVDRGRALWLALALQTTRGPSTLLRACQ